MEEIIKKSYARDHGLFLGLLREAHKMSQIFCQKSTYLNENILWINIMPSHQKLGSIFIKYWSLLKMSVTKNVFHN